MAARFIGVVGFVGEGQVEIEEEFDTVDYRPLYEHGKPFPVQYVSVPATETRRRVVTESEAQWLCELADRPTYKLPPSAPSL